MKIINVPASQTTAIVLGHKGEYNAVRVIFDVTELQTAYPGGTPQLLVRRPGEAVTYPAMFDFSPGGTTAAWDISAEWTKSAGGGNCQLNWFVVDEDTMQSQLKKSVTYQTKVLPAMGDDPAQTPDPYVEYLAEVTAAGAEAQSAASEAQAAQAAASASAVLSESWAVGGTDTRPGEDEDNAKYYAEDSAARAGDSQGWATTSKSWAVGDTGTRSGEDTNNSEYYAGQAKDSADDAQGYADDASGYANDASGYANDASGYANDASGYADDAQGYANSASGSAEDAEAWAVGERGSSPVAADDPTYENNAKYYAEQAEEQAKQYGAYVTPTVSGNPAAIDDGADGIPIKSINSLDIVAGQRLHGYSKPWPAGGGKNKLPMIVADLKSANTSGTWTENTYVHEGVTFQLRTDSGGNIVGIAVSSDGTGSDVGQLMFPLSITTDAQMVLSGCPSGAVDYFLYVSDGDDDFMDDGLGVTIPAATVLTQAGIVVSPEAGVLSTKMFYPMLRLATEPAGFEPYTNSSPIYGWSSTHVNACGKNFIGLPNVDYWVDETVPGNHDGMNVVLSDNGTISVSGNKNSAGTIAVCFNVFTGTVSVAAQNDNVLHLPEGQYKFGDSPSGFGLQIAVSQEEDASNITVLVADGNGVYTVPSGTRFSWVRLLTDAAAGAVSATITPMIYAAADTADYAEGQVQTREITFPADAGTVYGSTLVWLGGDNWRLAVTHNIVDMGSTAWGYSVGYASFYRQISGRKRSASFISSCYAPAQAKNGQAAIASAPDFGMYYEVAGDNIYVRDTSFNGDRTKFKTAVTGQKICYELATPLTYDFTATVEEISTVLGENYFWADCGGASVTYRADPTLAYEKLKNAILSLGGNV